MRYLSLIILFFLWSRTGEVLESNILLTEYCQIRSDLKYFSGNLVWIFFCPFARYLNVVECWTMLEFNYSFFPFVYEMETSGNIRV